MKRVHLSLVVGLGLAVSGCIGGSNVRGSWNCGPATAGSCAPTASIDEGAIKQIIANSNQASDGSAAVAAGAYGSETAGRRARVEFPAYTDERGRYHEPQIVYMNIADDVSVTDGSSAQAYGAARGSEPVRQNFVATVDAAVPAPVDAAALVPTDEPIGVGSAEAAAAAPAEAPRKPGFLKRVFGPKPKPASGAAAPAPQPDPAPVNAPDTLVPPTGE